MKVIRTCAVLYLVLGLFAAAALARQEAGPVVTLTGQVVCSKCYLDEDRKVTPYGSQSDLLCATRCAKDGIPPALAVTEGDATTLYILEKKPGKAHADAVTHLGKRVEVTGSVRAAGDKKYLSVRKINFTPEGHSHTPAGDVSAEPATALPAAAPELSLKDLSGVSQQLNSYRGKVVVLNFWATWCVPCRKEMPALVAIQNEFAAWGVHVVGASADEPGVLPEVVKFIREKKINFPVWLGATTDDMQRFGLGTELPATVIIDREGRVVARIRGMVKEAELRQQVESLIKGPDNAAISFAPGLGVEPVKRANVPS